MIKYLKSAAEAFNYNYAEAATFVVDNNPKAHVHTAAELQVNPLEHYHEFWSKGITGPETTIGGE